MNWRAFILATRGLLLLSLALPALFATILALARGNLAAILVNALGFSLYLLAVALLRWGEQHHQTIESKTLAPPGRPYKLMAALVTALATVGMARFGAGKTLPVSVVFGLGAFLGMLLTYGLDRRPARRPLPAGVYGIDAGEVLRILEDAERRVGNIAVVGKKIRNPELASRLERIGTIAGTIVSDLAEHPREIRKSRKFLNVYLDGVEKVVAGYARTHAQVPSEQLEENFRNVLIAIEETFQDQHRKLLENDVFDLDVQMEVLATQLKREGIV